MVCTKCNYKNQDGHVYCINCGEILFDVKKDQPIAEAPVLNQSPEHDFSPTLQPDNQNLSSLTEDPADAFGSVFQDLDESGQDSHYRSGLNIWGPFAGYGTRRLHTGWLMDGQGNKASDLVSKIGQKFIERQIPNSELTRERLIAKGIGVESRPYFILRHGQITLALNISGIGRDLFVSLASYIKPPISNFRVILLLIMIILGLLNTFLLPNVISNSITDFVNGLNINLFSSLGGSSGNNVLMLLCFIGPIGTINSIALGLFFIFSLYKWMSQRDFWAGLRVQPNEFDLDDLMAMEKTVEQTVRLSLDEIGLNWDDLKTVFNANEGRLI